MKQEFENRHQMGNAGFDEGIHVLDPVLHRGFLAQQRKDAYTQSLFAAGDRVVVCATCGSAHLFDSWHAAGDKCCGCNNQTFSRTLEGTPARPVEFKAAHDTPSVRGKRNADGAGFRRSIGSFFTGYEGNVDWGHKTQARSIAFLGMMAGIGAILLVWFRSHQSYQAFGDFWSEFAPSGLVRAICAGACGGFIGWIFRSLAGKIVEWCFYIFGLFMVPLYLFGGSADTKWPDAAGRLLSRFFLMVVNTVSVGVVVSYFFVVDSSRNEESAQRFVDLWVGRYSRLQNVAIKFGQDVLEANKDGRDTSEIWDKFCHDFGQALTEAQANPSDSFERAGKEYDRGEYDRAIADYTEAILLKPDDFAAYNNRGDAYEAIKKYDRAVADYTEAIRLRPDVPDVYNNRANAYYALGQWFRAETDWAKAKQLSAR